MRYKIKRKQADGSFVELSLDTSIDSIYRVKDGNIKSLTDILTEEYAPKDNPVFTGSISLGRAKDREIGVGSVAIGNNTLAVGEYSHAEGSGAAEGHYSHAEGSSNASAEYSHAEGRDTIASGYASHAEGYNTNSSGGYSHAEGYKTSASSYAAHAEGYTTRALGENSHAEGYSSTADGKYSHAEGKETYTSGENSHAEGLRTTAQGENQHVQGKYNIIDTEEKYAHIVGNGSADNTRSNAHTLDWDGNAWYAGEVQGTNLPYVISEKTVTTITNVKNTLSANVTPSYTNPYRRTVDAYSFEITGGENVSYFVTYSNKEYPVVMVGTKMYSYADDFEMMVDIELAVNANDPSTGADVTFYFYKIDNTDPTDIVLLEREIKYLDNKYLPKNISVDENIVIGGVGVQYATPRDDNDLTNKKYVDNVAEYYTKPLLSYSTFEVLSGYTYTDGFCPDVVFPFKNFKKWSAFEKEFFYSMTRYGCKVTMSFSDKSDTEHNAYVYNRLVGDKEPVVMLLMESTQKVGNNCVIEFFSKGGTTEGLDTDTGCYISPILNNCTSIKITLPNMPADRDYVNTTLDTKVAALVDSAPETLDTLKELSTALGDDPNFATTVATNIGTKLNKPTTEGTEGQVLSKAADGSNVWVDNGINEDALNAMLTNTFGFVAE